MSTAKLPVAAAHSMGMCATDICSNEQQAEAETEGSRAVWTPKWHSIFSDSGDTDSACKERMPESKTIFGCGNAEDSIEDMQLSQCTPPLPPLQASCTSACSIDTFPCQVVSLEGHMLLTRLDMMHTGA